MSNETKVGLDDLAKALAKGLEDAYNANETNIYRWISWIAMYLPVDDLDRIAFITRTMQEMVKIEQGRPNHGYRRYDS